MTQYGRKKRLLCEKKKKELSKERRQRQENGSNQPAIESDRQNIISFDAKAKASPSQLFVTSRIKDENGRRQFQPFNRMNTVFEKEPKEMVEERKQLAQKPIIRSPLPPFTHLYNTIIDIPKRPSWDYSMNKAEIEGQEEVMFEKYLKGIYVQFPRANLNYFEHNIEVWRQLWRVSEVSDVLLILADIRHPMFHFPPALYHYIVNDLKKKMILVLTKVDLVPQHVQPWIDYFTKAFPKLVVIPFCSFDSNRGQEEGNKEAVYERDKKKKLKTIKRGGYQPRGVESLIEAITALNITKNGKVVDILNYKPPRYDPVGDESKAINSSERVHEVDHRDSDLATSQSLDRSSSDQDDEELDESMKPNEDVLQDEPSEEEEVLRDGQDERNEYDEIEWKRKNEDDDRVNRAKNDCCLIVGLIGHPNVGKSTIVNAMKGKKVCSTSRTPGHTKWKQTIYLNKNLMLVDCPGLVFPAIDIPKPLQILAGVFPIAQVREPYSAVQYASQFIALEEIYKLDPAMARERVMPDPNRHEIPWSSWMILEAYASKRGYHTRGGNLDTQRAGREILFHIIDGHVLLSFLPPIRQSSSDPLQQTKSREIGRIVIDPLREWEQHLMSMTESKQQ